MFICAENNGTGARSVGKQPHQTGVGEERDKCKVTDDPRDLQHLQQCLVLVPTQPHQHHKLHSGTQAEVRHRQSRNTITQRGKRETSRGKDPTGANKSRDCKGTRGWNGYQRREKAVEINREEKYRKREKRGEADKGRGGGEDRRAAIT